MSVDVVAFLRVLADAAAESAPIFASLLRASTARIERGEHRREEEKP